jgi:hypothetical protein
LREGEIERERVGDGDKEIKRGTPRCDDGGGFFVVGDVAAVVFLEKGTEVVDSMDFFGGYEKIRVSMAQVEATVVVLYTALSHRTHHTEALDCLRFN